MDLIGFHVIQETSSVDIFWQGPADSMLHFAWDNIFLRNLPNLFQPDPIDLRVFILSEVELIDDFF